VKEVAAKWHPLFNGVAMGFDLFSLSFWLCRKGGRLDHSGSYNARNAGQPVDGWSTTFLKARLSSLLLNWLKKRRRAKRAAQGYFPKFKSF
jgi:hypothetical protein